jgi:Spy/CpxP family protein refolding chaperone
MKKLMMFGLMVGATALLASDSYAQRPGFGGGFGGGGLIMNKGVQEELKITDAQREQLAEKMKDGISNLGDFAKLKDLTKEERAEKMASMAKEAREKTQKIVADVLSADQVKRLKQIERQQSMINSLTSDEEVKKELRLSEEQLEKIKSIGEASRTEMRGIFEGARDNPREAQEKAAAIRKEAAEKAANVLDESQKSRWKDLVGAPFEVKFEARRPGGPDSPRPPRKKTDN